MSVEMQPQSGDTYINLPVTFDYRGGRSANKKNKIIATILIVVFVIIGVVVSFLNDNLVLWQQVVYSMVVCYIGLLLLRFVVLKEGYYSKIYEGLVQQDYVLDVGYLWQIFDIEPEYPYTCYYKNGQKGIFIRMEKDAVTGKPDTADFDHYEAISNAYNVAHALNMNIVHIDYMDNVGNDPRLQNLMDGLSDVENPDMQDLLQDIYENLQDEMSRTYTSFDIYLFLTRDKFDNFIYNVQTVANTMLGGNYITYKVLNRSEISGVCKALFNLHDFSIIDACETVVATGHHGVVPIRVTHADGSVDVLNKTVAEKKAAQEEAMRKALEEQEARKKKRKKESKKEGKKKSKVVNKVDDNGTDVSQEDGGSDDLGLF